MTRLSPIPVLTLALALAAALAPTPAGSAPAANQVLDRTYSCTLQGVGGGMYELEARAHAGTRAGRSWGRLPFAVFATGQSSSFETILQDSLVFVTAGAPNRRTTLEDAGFTPVSARAQQYGTLAINTRRCKRVRARVALSARGLEGGAASPLTEEHDCEAPRRVVIRVRATSTSAIRLSRDRALLKARVAFRSGYIAARTQAGKALLFATVSESGKTRIFTAPPPRCFPD